MYITIINKQMTIPSKDSPFFIEESEGLTSIAVPPNLCIAALNEQAVRVLAS